MNEVLFSFNDRGMCENPEVIQFYKAGSDQGLIRLAQIPNGCWCFGYSWDVGTGGSSSAAGFNEYRKTYATRLDALLTALEEAKTWAGYYEGWGGDYKEPYRKFGNAVDKYRASLFQLTLFA